MMNFLSIFGPSCFSPTPLCFFFEFFVKGHFYFLCSCRSLGTLGPSPSHQFSLPETLVEVKCQWKGHSILSPQTPPVLSSQPFSLFLLPTSSVILPPPKMMSSSLKLSSESFPKRDPLRYFLQSRPLLFRTTRNLLLFFVGTFNVSPNLLRPFFPRTCYSSAFWNGIAILRRLHPLSVSFSSPPFFAFLFCCVSPPNERE